MTDKTASPGLVIPKRSQTFFFHANDLCLKGGNHNNQYDNFFTLWGGVVIRNEANFNRDSSVSLKYSNLPRTKDFHFLEDH